MLKVLQAVRSTEILVTASQSFQRTIVAQRSMLQILQPSAQICCKRSVRGGSYADCERTCVQTIDFGSCGRQTMRVLDSRCREYVSNLELFSQSQGFLRSHVLEAGEFDKQFRALQSILCDLVGRGGGELGVGG